MNYTLGLNTGYISALNNSDPRQMALCCRVWCADLNIPVLDDEYDICTNENPDAAIVSYDTDIFGDEYEVIDLSYKHSLLFAQSVLGPDEYRNAVQYMTSTIEPFNQE